MLREPNYRLFLFGQALSQTGTWMQRLAQAWLVLDLTGSALSLGLVLALQFLPILVLALPSGVLADRLPKHAFVTVLQIGGVAQAATLAALTLTGRVELWHVYALALASGALSALENPARMSFVGELVDRADLHRAVALNSSVFNLTRMIGPAIAGGIVAAWGPGWCFALNSASYLAVVLALLAMDRARLHPHRRAAAGGAAALLGGVRYAARRPEIAGVLIALFFMGTFGYNFAVIAPALARFTFDVGPTGLGLMNTAIGAGALAGALVVASRAAPRPERIVGAAGAYAAMLIAVSLTPAFALVLVALALTGLASYLFFASATAAVQLASEEDVRGRVLSFFILLSTGTAPLGNSWTGVLTEAWGPRAALAANGVLCLAGSLLALAYLRGRGAAEPPTGGSAPRE